MLEKRVLKLSGGSLSGGGPVVYWMSRDQRIRDNWALTFAAGIAREKRKGLVVTFCLSPGFLSAPFRHYAFMLGGLREVERSLADFHIPFLLMEGLPGEKIPEVLRNTKASCLVSDFDPLRIKRRWKQEVQEKTELPFFEVDAHNIVPCRFVSNKPEYGAHTLRRKIAKVLPAFLENNPLDLEESLRMAGRSGDYRGTFGTAVDWDGAMKRLSLDSAVGDVPRPAPGSPAGTAVLDEFLSRRIEGYAVRRNDPNAQGQSNLSPYLHFGQISAARIAMEVLKRPCPPEDREAFLEELIVRRELSDNFCLYNPLYDTFAGFPRWARESLDARRKDPRDYLYTRDEFDAGRTHEDLWNAAQRQLVLTGKLHGYLRMYWAKKILEWSSSPEEALLTALRLNDRYSLDGRDPNGYAGCAWAVGGVHDRPWFERPIFGKIRYMNRAGAARKFDVPEYVRRWSLAG